MQRQERFDIFDAGPVTPPPDPWVIASLIALAFGGPALAALALWASRLNGY